METKVYAIAAWDNDFGIGRDGGIPWKSKEDTAFFKHSTIGHIVIMGRKTYDSIGKPLPGRMNIVVTRQAKEIAFPQPTTIDGPFYLPSLVGAVNHAKFLSTWSCSQAFGRKIFIIGGGEIYKLALEQGLVDTVIANHFRNIYNCDTHFPVELLEGWRTQVKFDCYDFNTMQFDKPTVAA